MTIALRRATLATCLMLPLAISSSCVRSQEMRRSSQPARIPVLTLGTLTALDPIEMFRRVGVLTTTGAVSFVGNVRFLAGPTPDSVLAIIAVSLPTRSLTFTREGDHYRAAYAVEFELLEKTTGAARTAGWFRAQETVRVSSLRETTRDEESVIFQQVSVVSPGSYAASLTVHDLGANRSGTAEMSIAAPRFGSARDTITTTATSIFAVPMVVYNATPRASRASYPDLIMSARSTGIFGRDSIVRVYLEWYGANAVGPADRAPSVRISVTRTDDGRELHTSPVIAGSWSADGRIATAIAQIPVSLLGLGRLHIKAWQDGRTDTVSAPLFISATDDLAATSLEELLGYLRYFATSERLRVLRDTTPAARAATWRTFLRATDPSPATPEHEGLREYFSRLAVANARFRGEEVPGWLSDRGMVYSTLGEPDRIIDPRAGRTVDDRLRQRTQVWEYAQHRLRLIFTAEKNASRWRLTPSSEVEFQTIARRVRR